MPQEIERKFLVDPARLPEVRAAATAAHAIVQGYLSAEPAVRVRLKGEQGYLTIKGSGLLTRDEYEYPIPGEDARALLELCPLPLLEKTRYDVPFGGRLWEVDDFGGANAGLVIAEVELPDADADVACPPWAGREVTGDPRYTNVALAQHPYPRSGEAR